MTPKRKCRDRDAVGTLITERPPHRAPADEPWLPGCLHQKQFYSASTYCAPTIQVGDCTLQLALRIREGPRRCASEIVKFESPPCPASKFIERCGHFCGGPPRHAADFPSVHNWQRRKYLPTPQFRRSASLTAEPFHSYCPRFGH